MPERIIEKTVLKAWNQGRYREYRIPGLIATAKGSILCCCEARYEDHNDWAKTDIMLFRSTDGGRTFSETVVVKGGTGSIVTYNNPVWIANGETIHLIWFQDYRKAFYQASRDDGVTFSSPVEITGAFEAYRSRYPWTVIAAGPGHGIALRGGRLLVPVWMAEGKAVNGSDRVKEHIPSVVGAIFSDNGGLTWQGGDMVSGIENGNETTAVELANGKVLFNIRHGGALHYRTVSVSDDGAHAFSKVRYDAMLPDPWCFASLVKGADGRIFFVNCANGENHARTNLTIKSSMDSCETWREEAFIDLVGGYADICVQDDYIYCLYERTVKKSGKMVIGQLVFCRIGFH